MEMERINDNTIRVTILNEELKERGISALDLVGNHQRIEKFFYSILKEIDDDDTFGDTDAVTFQVLPNHDGLELIISRSTEEDDVANNLINSLGAHKSENLQSMPNVVKQKFGNRDHREKFLKNAIGQSGNTYPNINVAFSDFENLLGLVEDHQIKVQDSALTKVDNSYYLSVFFDSTLDREDLNEIISQMSDYGEVSTKSFEFIKEYGEEIISHNAIDVLNSKF